MTQGPVLSVVDYAAWEKGYMPPSEHILIDQLAYRGARVVMSSDFGDHAYWLVMRGTRLYGRKLLAVRAAIENALDALAEDATDVAAAERALAEPGEREEMDDDDNPEYFTDDCRTLMPAAKALCSELERDWDFVSWEEMSITEKHGLLKLVEVVRANLPEE